MKKLGLYFIIIGLALALSALYFGLIAKSVIVKHQIYMVISGVPTLCLGIAFRYIEKEKARRKKTAIVILMISLVLISAGILSRYLFHIPGASVEIIFGAFLFSFSFGPLFTKSRFEKWSDYVGSSSTALILSLADLFSVTLIIVGLLFKVQKWPGSEEMIFSGIAILPLTSIAWNRILGQQLILRKQAESKLEIAWEELSEKNNEILDSISYAKRIQHAILPPNSLVKECLKDSFVLYKPKDVVAGDFYWLEKVDNKVIFAAADCTGHGVPGAMVSVVCNNALNRSVREYGLKSPGKILDKARDIVIQEFERSEEEVKDGMDIALCSIEGKHLEFAGAHNPLWIVRDNEIIEVKADKQPIGKFDNQKPFTNHELELKAEDLIYIFSDGYVDQFGGPKGKKFKPKALRELLLRIHKEPMDKQKSKIDETIEKWRGSLEQVDDICVIGIRVN
jgi:serine phosphatase RsbU (regulator of sigma subunit)